MEYYGVILAWVGSLQHRPMTSSCGRIILTYSVLGVFVRESPYFERVHPSEVSIRIPSLPNE